LDRAVPMIFRASQAWLQCQRQLRRPDHEGKLVGENQR
jgi:hypothetical protein